MKRLNIKAATVLLSVGLLVAGCGGGSSDTGSANGSQGGNGSGQSENSGNMESQNGSNIPYLRQNHANYSEYGSTVTPAPVKDAASLSINWTIAAKTEYDATQLADHIRFMVNKLEEGENPRAWDKLFLMEAYMKVNHYYTTSVENTGTTVVVSKNATNACAYAVISAHSDAVSGDFFARGDIMQDYTTTAENILASSACNGLRSDIETYISQRQKQR